MRVAGHALHAPRCISGRAPREPRRVPSGAGTVLSESAGDPLARGEAEASGPVRPAPRHVPDLQRWATTQLRSTTGTSAGRHVGMREAAIACTGAAQPSPRASFRPSKPGSTGRSRTWRAAGSLQARFLRLFASMKGSDHGRVVVSLKLGVAPDHAGHRRRVSRSRRHHARHGTALGWRCHGSCGAGRTGSDATPHVARPTAQRGHPPLGRRSRPLNR